MRLHHTTHRRHCPSVAEHGFRESRAGQYGPGVYLSETITERVKGDTVGDLEVGDAHLLAEELVVFAFDLPDDLATRHAVRLPPYSEWEEVPDDEPLDGPDEDGETDATIPEHWPAVEYVVPAEIANRYCAGLVHWTGGHPLTDAQVAMIEARRTRQ